ncbi:MAG: hypothetical protein J6T10_22480 [Methanobrevibacter sp.]|nr:hypothetical protein [Methanobrevibacter sp.]
MSGNKLETLYILNLFASLILIMLKTAGKIQCSYLLCLSPTLLYVFFVGIVVVLIVVKIKKGDL